MKPSKIIVIVASALLLIAFFLPWVKVFFMSVSAWDIVMDNPSRTPLKAYLLFLFPISAIINIILTATSNKTTIVSRLFRLIPMLLIVGALISVMMKSGGGGGSASGIKGLFQIIGIGVYLTLLSSLTLLAMAFMKETTTPMQFSQEPASPAPTEPETPSEEPLA